DERAALALRAQPRGPVARTVLVAGGVGRGEPCEELRVEEVRAGPHEGAARRPRLLLEGDDAAVVDRRDVVLPDLLRGVGLDEGAGRERPLVGVVQQVAM